MGVNNIISKIAYTEFDVKELQGLLQECIKPPAIRKAINNIMCEFLKRKSESEKKEISDPCPLYTLGDTVYYALPSVVKLRNDLLDQFKPLKLSQIVKYGKEIPALSRVATMDIIFSQNRSSLEAVRFLDNIIKIDLLRRSLKEEYASDTDGIHDRLLIAGDYSTVRGSVKARWERLEKLNFSSFYANYKDPERLEQEIELQREFESLVDKWKEFDPSKEQSAKEQNLFEEELNVFVTKYEFPLTKRKDYPSDSNFSPKILEPKSKIVELIEKIFMKEPERIEILKKKLNSIKLETSYYVEVCLLPIESNKDVNDDLARLIKKFTCHRAFNEALKSIEMMTDSNKKLKVLLELMITLLKDNSGRGLKKIIASMCSSEFITPEELKYLYNILKEAAGPVKEEVESSVKEEVESSVKEEVESSVKEEIVNRKLLLGFVREQASSSILKKLCNSYLAILKDKFKDVYLNEKEFIEPLDVVCKDEEFDELSAVREEASQMSVDGVSPRGCCVIL